VAWQNDGGRRGGALGAVALRRQVAFFRSFRLDLEIRQIDDQALLLALLVEGTEDGDGNR